MFEIILITSRLGLAHALVTAFEGSEYIVTAVPNVEKAMSLGGKHPHIIILGDTNQPFFYTTRLLQSHPMTKNIPILLHSDNFSIHNPDYIARLGVQAVLGAPLSLRQLRESIESCLHQTIA